MAFGMHIALSKDRPGTYGEQLGPQRHSPPPPVSPPESSRYVAPLLCCSCTRSMRRRHARTFWSWHGGVTMMAQWCVHCPTTRAYAPELCRCRCTTPGALCFPSSIVTVASLFIHVIASLLAVPPHHQVIHDSGQPGRARLPANAATAAAGLCILALHSSLPRASEPRWQRAAKWHGCDSAGK